MPGGDMQRLLRQGRIPLAKSLDYIEQVCSGLGHAHERGVIHRDVKPQNLLLTSDHQTVKIADFGVARFSHSDSPITRVGTNIYAPPEHSPLLADDSGVVTIAKLTPAADIYSLAKSVYAIITSESPRYYANQPITQLPLDVRDEKWSGQLLHILEKATQNDPAARYQSIDEFWQQLAELKRTALAGTSTSKPFPVAGGPQAHVAPGYSPIAPAEPKFNTSRDLKIRFPAIMPDARKTTEMSDDLRTPSIDEFGWPGNEPVIPAVSNGQSHVPDPPAVYNPSPRKKRRFLRKAVSFVVFIGLFAGLLYGTHAYLRGSGLLPEISNPFSQHTATANTDIYLRPSPNTNNDPVGLVTKNSKVRIVNSQNNWYQVDVIEQGRSRANQAAVSRGWLNGKYLDMD
jgi:serine/threonine protein kinase